MEQADSINEILKTVKIDKGIDDNSLDSVLTKYIKQASDMVCLYVNETDLPTQLETIVARMTEAHYIQTMNDADGAKSYSEEGASWAFNDNEIQPYMALLDKYLDNRDNRGSKGRVWSW